LTMNKTTRDETVIPNPNPAQNRKRPDNNGI
jgi:hypothetical protein